MIECLGVFRKFFNGSDEVTDLLLKKLSLDPSIDATKKELDASLDDHKLKELLAVHSFETLSLRFSGVTDSGLLLISEKCPGLIGIDVTGCRNITEEGLTVFLKKMPQLETLNISALDVSDQLLFVIQDKCKLLRNLIHHKVIEIPKIDIGGLSGIIRDYLRGNNLDVPEGLSHHVEIAVNAIGGEEKLLTPAGIDTISKMGLDSLSIYYHPRVDYSDLLPLKGRVKQLYLPNQFYDRWDRRMLDWEDTYVGPKKKSSIFA